MKNAFVFIKNAFLFVVWFLFICKLATIDIPNYIFGSLFMFGTALILGYYLIIGANEEEDFEGR